MATIQQIQEVAQRVLQLETTVKQLSEQLAQDKETVKTLKEEKKSKHSHI